VRGLNKLFRISTYSVLWAAGLLGGLLAITLSVLGGPSTPANDVYIAQNSAGAANGADCADARAVTFFNDSNSWGSASSQIGAGTTVHLCGTITTPLTAQGSGSSGSPVVILFESGANMTTSVWPGTGAINVDGRSWITIDGGTNGTIANTGNSTTGSHANSTAIRAVPCSNCEFRNLTIADIYDHTSSSDTAVDQTQVNCIEFQGSNILIHDNTMHDSGWCLSQNYTNDSNVRIYNNNISRMDHGIACAGANFVVSSEYIFNNHFHDMSNWDTGTADIYHHDGVHCFNGSGGKIQNLYVYNNLFDGNEGNCCVTAWVFLEGAAESTPWTDSSGTAYIWNNVFIGSLDSPNGQLAVDAGSGHLIYNNTFDMIGTPQSGGKCFNDRGGVGSLTLTMTNNVFNGCAQAVSMDPAVTSITWDYNAYGNLSGMGNEVFNWTGHTNGNASSLSAWQSQCSCDSHSVGVVTAALALTRGGVPLAGFVGSQGVNLANRASGALASLSSGTTAGNSMAPVLRPPSGPWDIGAYEAGTNASLPLPPTGLRAIAK
jgi:hypothetical protein